MSMTDLQREAMVRAQRGDWQLADAMEIDARAEDDHRDIPFMHGITVNGRLRFLMYAYSRAVECTDCDGTGKQVCSECGHEAACTECDGEGEVLNTEGLGPFFDCEMAVTDLNGVVIEDVPHGGGQYPPNGKPVDAITARQILKEYRESICTPAKPGKAIATNPTQTPLIPENFQCA